MASMADITVYDPTTGAVLQTISDPMRATYAHEVIRFLCSKKWIDVRTCVAFVTPDGDVVDVTTPQAWQSLRSNWAAVAARWPGIGVTSARKSSLALPKARA